MADKDAEKFNCMDGVRLSFWALSVWLVYTAYGILSGQTSGDYLETAIHEGTCHDEFDVYTSQWPYLGHSLWGEIDEQILFALGTSPNELKSATVRQVSKFCGIKSMVSQKTLGTCYNADSPTKKDTTSDVQSWFPDAQVAQTLSSKTLGICRMCEGVTSESELYEMCGNKKLAVGDCKRGVKQAVEKLKRKHELHLAEARKMAKELQANQPKERVACWKFEKSSTTYPEKDLVLEDVKSEQEMFTQAYVLIVVSCFTCCCCIPKSDEKAKQS